MIVSNTDWESMPDEPVVKTGRIERVPHKLKIELMRRAAVEGGFDAGTQLTWMSPDERDVVAVTEIREPDSQATALCVAFKGSHRKGSGVGMRWYHGVCLPDGGGVCLLRSADSKRQTSVEGVREFLTHSIDTFAVNQDLYRRQISRLKTIKMTEPSWHQYMIGQAKEDRRDHDFVTWAQLGRVDKLFRSTRGKTAWDLIVCFSRATGNYTHYRLDQLYKFGERLLERAKGDVDD